MNLEKKKLSDTLNLPHTDFPMKADLANREPLILKVWESKENPSQQNLYERRMALRANASRDKTFLLHDGPPYANGHLHIGHAVNKILKDMVIRSKFLEGFHTPYIPGWDCHGLPIEINVEKKIGKVGSKKKEGGEVTAKEFRAACRAYAEEWVGIQKGEFKRLGVLGDWDQPYKTMDPKIEAGIVRALGKIVEKGDIAQGFKPVHWCFDCGSSLAEAEIEYAEKESPAIDVKFAVVGQEEILEKFNCLGHKGSGEISFVIWTTTPWTLPMNRAVALKQDIFYELIQVGTERLIIAEGLVESVMRRCGIVEYEVLGSCRAGEQLGLPVYEAVKDDIKIRDNILGHTNDKGYLSTSTLDLCFQLKHPFMDRLVPIIFGEHVTADSGTGAVHIAPAHGEEDYKIGQLYHLEMDHYIQDNGTFKLGEETPSNSPLTGGGPIEAAEKVVACKQTETTSQIEAVDQSDEQSPPCQGRVREGLQASIRAWSFDRLHIWKANPIIIDLLKENGKLLHQKNFKHSYPHCWRHKTPVIFRATPQFFITMDKSRDLDNETTRSRIPDFNNTLRNNTLTAIKEVKWLPAWGMERMRLMIENRPDWCISRQRTWGVPLPFVLNKNKLFRVEDQHIDEAATFIEANGIDAFDEAPVREGYEKVQGVPDVWFESGLTHEVVLKDRYPEFAKAENFQADLYLEGSDQYRGWFQSSLLTSVAINGRAPYKQVITHGFVVDAQGRKMSKSIGNVIAPETIIKKYGVDVLRLWVASTDYSTEMVVSDEVLNRTADVYRRIRNTARFLLANTVDFESHHCEEHSDVATQTTPSASLPPLHRGEFKTTDYSYYRDLDAWALSKTIYYQNEITKHYEHYDFVSAIQAVQHFCAIELGGFYLDVIKDRLYTYPKHSPERISAQKTLLHILEALVRWIAPVLSFTAEEIWKMMPHRSEGSSVHLSEWYDFGSLRPSGEKVPVGRMRGDFDWDEQIIPLRNAVNKQLEIARQSGKVGSPLETKVMLYVHDTALKTTLDQLGDDLRFILITSAVSIEEGSKASQTAVLSEDYSKASIEILKLDHEKCARCWHRCPDLQTYDQDDEAKICERCVQNISN